MEPSGGCSVVPEEATQWEAFVKRHYPQREIPKTSKERKKFHKEVDKVLLHDTAFEELHKAFQTKITLAVELIRDAVDRSLGLY